MYVELDSPSGPFAVWLSDKLCDIEDHGDRIVVRAESYKGKDGRWVTQRLAPGEYKSDTPKPLLDELSDLPQTWLEDERVAWRDEADG
jgi:hypothetical protein